jgi:hypothetical protein
MPGTYGHPIVETAIQLLMELPNEPALSILDRAMQGHHGSDPDFESCDVSACSRPHPVYGDELDPPSPFAELIRRAFAPQLDPRELAMLGLRDESDDPALQKRIQAVADEWHAVVERFGERYRLWGA